MMTYLVKLRTLGITALFLVAVFPLNLMGASKSETLRRTLFSFEADGNNCLWKSYDPQSRKSEILIKSKNCPDPYVAFLTERKEIVSAAGRFQWRSKEGLVPLPALPPPFGKDAEIEELWISQNGLINVAYLDTKVEKVGTQKLKSLRDGKIYPIPNKSMDGSLALAVRYELNGTTWKKVEVRVTTDGADLAQGLSAVVDGHTHPKVLRWGALSGQFSGKWQSQNSSKTHSFETDLSKKNELGDFSQRIAFGRNAGFLFNRFEGELDDHAMGPLVYCQENCKSHSKVEGFGETDQFAIQIQGDFALISNEYEGSNALLFKTGESKPVIQFPKNAKVIWLPWSD